MPEICINDPDYENKVNKTDPDISESLLDFIYYNYRNQNIYFSIIDNTLKS